MFEGIPGRRFFIKVKTSFLKQNGVIQGTNEKYDF